MDFDKITTPTLILDKAKCIQNISMMAEKAQQYALQLRPHFKTHQSKTVATWYKQYGIDKITVSSVTMAHYFADAKWGDITIAFPVNIREIDSINALAKKTSLNLTVENTESIEFLSQNLKYRAGIFIKIDTGYRRTGVTFDIFIIIDRILDKIAKSNKLQFMGFLSHAGHTYHAGSVKEILDINNDSLHKLNLLKNHYIEKYPGLIISIGDTPSQSLAENFEGIDEIRPGNYVFYDLMQYKLGACKLNQIAVAMACPVVARHKDRMQVIIYGGGVHFSKEFVEMDNQKVYGLVANLNQQGWNELTEKNYLIKISQEHGTILASDDLFNNCKIGDLVGIIPVHSCLTANLMKGYITTENEFVDHMEGNQ